jgi:hypothetical protein
MCQFLIFHLLKILSSLNPTNPNSDIYAAYVSSLFTHYLLIVVTGDNRILIQHYDYEIGNNILDGSPPQSEGEIVSRPVLFGMYQHYYRKAA